MDASAGMRYNKVSLIPERETEKSILNGRRR